MVDVILGSGFLLCILKCLSFQIVCYYYFYWEIQFIGLQHVTQYLRVLPYAVVSMLNPLVSAFRCDLKTIVG